MFHLLVQKIQLESIIKKHIRVKHKEKKKKEVPRNKKPYTAVKKKEVKGSPKKIAYRATDSSWSRQVKA